MNSLIGLFKMYIRTNSNYFKLVYKLFKFSNMFNSNCITNIVV